MNLNNHTPTIIKLNPRPRGFGEIADRLDGASPSKKPAQHTHDYYINEELGIYVGVWDTTDMIEAAEPYSMDEFMLIIEGQAMIKNNLTGEQVIINAGETFVIPKGYDCQWHQHGYLRKFYFIYDPPNEAIPNKPTHDGVVLPTANQVMTAAESANPFIQGELVSQKEFIDYQDISAKFCVRTWQTESFSSTLRAFPYHQLSIVQEGAIKVIDRQNNSQTFCAGDVFFIQKDTICAAEAQQTVTFISASLKL